MSRPEVTDRKLSATDRLALSVPEAGRLLGIGKNASYEAASRGELPTIRIGGRILGPRAALERLLAGKTSL